MTLGAIGKSGKWKKINYMPYKMLRLRWETVLLNNLEKEIGVRDPLRDWTSCKSIVQFV